MDKTVTLDVTILKVNFRKKAKVSFLIIDWKAYMSYMKWNILGMKSSCGREFTIILVFVVTGMSCSVTVLIYYNKFYKVK